MRGSLRDPVSGQAHAGTRGHDRPTAASPLRLVHRSSHRLCHPKVAGQGSACQRGAGWILLRPLENSVQVSKSWHRRYPGAKSLERSAGQRSRSDRVRPPQAPLTRKAATGTHTDKPGSSSPLVALTRDVTGNLARSPDRAQMPAPLWRAEPKARARRERSRLDLNAAEFSSARQGQRQGQCDMWTGDRITPTW